MGKRNRLVGFGIWISDWTWNGSPPRSFVPGDIKWVSEEEFWRLKTMWPDGIYDLSPKRWDTYTGEIFDDKL